MHLRYHHHPLAVAATLFSLTSILLLSASTHADEFADKVNPFVKKHCIACHDQREEKGDFRIDQLSRDLSDPANAIAWQDAVDLVKLSEMPPPEQPAPTEAELNAFVSAVDEAIKAEAMKGAATRTEIRRLSLSAMENTAKDLLGTRLSLSQGLPADPEVAGFDNMAEALGQSDEFMETLQNNSRRLARDVISYRSDPRDREIFNMSKIKKGSDVEGRKNEYVLYSSRSRSNTVWPEKFSAPRTGVYRIQLKAFQTDNRYALNAAGKELKNQKDVGPIMPQQRTRFAAIMAVPAEAMNESMKTESAGGTEVGLIEIGKKMGMTEVEVVLEKGQNFFVYAIDTYRTQRVPTANVGGKKMTVGELLHLKEIRVEGPLMDSWPTRVQQALLPEKANVPVSQRLDVLELSSRRLNGPYAFLTRAFRRPITKGTLGRYKLMYEIGVKAGLTRESAMQNVVESVLCSPRFLYNFDTGEKDAWAIASRLSYFLWNTMPDDELLALADAGELLKPEVIEDQVTRMLSDPRVDQFVSDFTAQWLGLKKVGAMPPDPDLYPEYDKALEHAIRTESETLFKNILNNNRPITEFLAPGYAMLNERLAIHYGIDNVQGTEFRKVSLPSDSPRGGLLGHASMLTITSDGTRTSPVVRGVWVLESLLDSPPSPPPADVEAIEPDVRGATSIREMLAKHRDVASCRECHRRIDPWGFGLENFNAIGAWRDNYFGARKKKQKMPSKGKPVDSTGTFADGKDFEGVEGLKSALLKRSDRFAHALTAKLFAHALGHPATVAEKIEIDEIVAANKSSGGRFSDLITAICTSKSFRGIR